MPWLIVSPPPLKLTYLCHENHGYEECGLREGFIYRTLPALLMVRFWVMPTEYIIALLVAERDKLNRAIEALGGIVKRRRGRPPKNPLAAVASALPRKKKRNVTAAQRKAQAVRMK